MRRVLLGGLGIALGVLARPAVAQDWPPRPASAQTAPRSAERGVRLGRPVAVPDTSPADAGVTPAGGLFSRNQPAPIPPSVAGQPYTANQSYPSYPVGTPYPGGQPYVVSQTSPGQPMTGTPMIGTPMTGVPMGTPMPMQGGMPPITTQVPPPKEITGQGGPSITEMRDAGRGIPGATVGPPTAVPGPGFAPSVVPGGVPYPVPEMDDPMACQPGCDAFGRLRGMGCADRWWVSGEYLMWWTRGPQLPTLVTTGPPPAPGTPLMATQPVVPGSLSQSPHSGARFGAGWWFNDSQRRGIDARFFFLGTWEQTFTTNSNQFPVLARPYTDANPATLAVFQPLDVIAAPGMAVGGVAVNLQNSLWGAEVNYRRNLLAGCYGRLDALFGYRFVNFKETLTMSEAALLLADVPVLALPAGSAIMRFDSLRAENNFHGGQVGLAGEVRRGRWSVDGRASIAFGTVYQTADITGGAAVLVPPSTLTVAPGGLLALPGANIGHFSQSKFAVVPEVGVNFGYNVTPGLRLFVGYNFLYLSNVLRPAGMVNQVIDAARDPVVARAGLPTLQAQGVPPPGLPAPTFRTSDFFAQGISFGLQYRW